MRTRSITPVKQCNPQGCPCQRGKRTLNEKNDNKKQSNKMMTEFSNSKQNDNWKIRYMEYSQPRRTIANENDYFINEYTKRIEQLLMELNQQKDEIELIKMKNQELELYITKIKKNDNSFKEFQMKLEKENESLLRKLTAFEQNDFKYQSEQLKQLNDQLEENKKKNKQYIQQISELEMINKQMRIEIDLLKRKNQAFEEDRESYMYQEKLIREQLLQQMKDFHQQEQQFSQQRIIQLEQQKNELIAKITYFQQDQNFQVNFEEQLRLYQQQVNELQGQKGQIEEYVRNDINITFKYQEIINQLSSQQQNTLNLQTSQVVQIQDFNDQESLRKEIDALKKDLDQKLQEDQKNHEIIHKQNGYIQKQENYIDQLIQEIELIKMKFLEVEQQRKTENKIKDDQFNDILNQFKASMQQQLDVQNHQIVTLKNILDTKIKENEQLQKQKNEMAIKLNETNVYYQQQIIQYQLVKSRLFAELEQSRFQESGMTQQSVTQSPQKNLINYQIPSDQLIYKMDMDIKNLQIKYDQKLKECEQWKQAFQVVQQQMTQ